MSTSDCERVELGVHDLLRRLERAAAAEDRQPCEQLLLLGCEEVVAPLDRRAEGALAFGQVAGAPGQQRQPALEPLQDLGRRERLHPGGGELERERQLVEPAADRCHRVAVLEAGIDGPRAGEEEADPFLRRERRHGVLLLAGQVKRLPARDQQLEAGAGAEQLPQRAGRLDHLLEVVEQDEQPLVADVLGELGPRPERLRRRREHELRVPQRRKRHPPDALGIPLRAGRGCLEREPRLAAPARPGEGEQAHVLPREQPQHLRQFRSRPRNGVAGTGRFVWWRLASGGNSHSPSWKIRSGADRSFSRCSPRSRSPSGPSSAAVAAETSTCPPCPAAAIRAARCTSTPTYPSSSACGVPVWTPIRTRIGPCTRSSIASAAAASAPGAVGNATKNASPCVSTSTPPWAPNARRRTRRCSASASA